MFFTILNRFGNIPNNAKSQAFLIWDNWNDFSYYTLFSLKYVDDGQKVHEIGSVKIGYVGQKKNDRNINIDDTFNSLGSNNFSLGQDDMYYETLNKLGDQVRDSVLNGLNDIAKSTLFYDIAIKEDVTFTSLLRDVSSITVTGQYRRMASGGVRLTDYDFSFRTSDSKMDLYFKVRVDSVPPTNIHILIGRNGVGKTNLINNMIDHLYDGNSSSKNYGEFIYDEFLEDGNKFPNLITISFSAFDNTTPKLKAVSGKTGIKYTYIGLKKKNEGATKYDNSKGLEDLIQDFVESLASCIRNSKVKKWIDAIEKLESDTNFKEADIKSLVSISDEDEYKQKASKLFHRLSSGHKIILLTITKLIESIQEKSLVFIDEPEAHLHPPLLSAFTRALSELMVKNNGVAIIATHSPVLLQEVPNSCVWKLRRIGAEAKAERLAIQSFGENVGVLTSEVFGLEVTNSGFYELLKEAVNKTNSYEESLRFFNEDLGMEARSILMSLFYNKNNPDM